MNFLPWLSQASNSNLLRSIGAIVSLPGALWGAWLFFRWLRGTGIDSTLDGIKADLNRLVRRQQERVPRIERNKRISAQLPSLDEIPKDIDIPPGMSAEEARAHLKTTIEGWAKTTRQAIELSVISDDASEMILEYESMAERLIKDGNFLLRLTQEQRATIRTNSIVLIILGVLLFATTAWSALVFFLK